MSLRVWLPLTKDLRQQGLDSTTVTQNSGTTISSGGKLGSCLTATSNATVVVNFSSLAAMLANGKSYSLACWVKITGNVTTNSWIIKLGTNNCGLWWAASTARWVWNENDDGKRCADPTISADTTNWHHLVTTVTKSSNGSTTTARHYVDGIPATSYEIQTWDNSGNAQPTGTTITISPYAASLNDIRLYDHCLSPMEIKELAKGLVLHYPLNRQGWGQENLLLNTQVLTPNSSTSTKNCSQRGSSVRQLRSDGFYEAKCTAAWQGLSTWANAQNLVVGQKYTYSFYFYTNGSTKSLSFYPMMYNSSGTRDTSSTLPVSVDGSAYQNGNARAFGIFSNTIPIRHYVTFEWNSTMASIISNGGTIELSIQVHGTFNSGEYGCVYAPKLEIGDKMTPWCPNIADTNNMGLNSTTEYDCSGFCNNGTRTGTFTWTSDTPKYAVSTHIGTTSSKIHISNFPTSGFGNSYSFAWWGKRSSNSPMFWGFSDGIRLNGMYGGTLWNTGDSSNNPIYKPDTTTTITAPSVNVWHHYVMTGDGTTCKLYVDGILYGQAKTYKAISGTSIYINGWDSGTSYCSDNTDISDFRIYATALLADDVKSLYQNCATIGPDGTIYGQIRN